ncbi:hypothetical protein PL598_05980, partial [Phocaeicola vulgatus]|nr:hypothetical protein [Phocaeicola vulgatus]
TKVIILILWWRNFQLEYWRTFQLVSTGTAYYPPRHHGDTLFLLQRAMRKILSLHPVLQQNGADVSSLQKERGPLLGLFMMKYFKLDL